MTYPRPPITEAVIDLRVTLPTEIDIARILQASPILAEKYPDRQERREFTGQFIVKDGRPVTNATDHGVNGFLYWNEGRTQAVQFRLDGFTFSRLAPYENWAAMTSEAKRLWEIYAAQLTPLYVTRVGLRYINRIEVPADTRALGEYFLVPSGMPAGVEEAELENVAAQVAMRFPGDVRARLGFVSAPAARPNTLPFILDIDVFTEAAFDTSSQPAIWDTLDMMRTIRTELFERSISDLTRALFQ